MARDYKHRRGASRRGKTATPPWLWLFSGFATGLVVAAVIYTLLRGSLETDPSAPEPRSPEPRRALIVEEPEPTAEPPAEATQTRSRYTFYEELPNFEVVIPETEQDVPRNRPAKPVAKPGAYVLQVGSFRNYADAERRKAELALHGIESRVQKVTIDNDQTWHRVRVGPIDRLGDVNRLRTELADSGFQFMLLRVGN